MRAAPGDRAFRQARIAAAAAAAWAATAFVSLTGERDARADCPRAVNGCIDADSLWSHAGAQRFVGVGGTETVAAGQLAFGLDTSWASRPVLLHLASPAPGGSDSPAVNNLVDATFLWAYGITDRLELDVAVPMTFAQDGDGTSGITGSSQQLHSTAFRDLRFGVAYALVPRKRVATTGEGATNDSNKPDVFGLTARFEMSAPTGQDDRFAGEPGAVFVPSIAADYRRRRAFAGLELGARLRQVTELGDTRMGSQITIAGGIGYDLLRSKDALPRDLISVSIEARALPVLVAQSESTATLSGPIYKNTGGALVPAEWELAVRSAPIKGGDFAFQLGGGGALDPNNDTVTTPRFRFTLGLRYAPMRYDSDGDGVPDSVDKCPTHPGDKKDDGCEPPPEAPPEVFDNTTPAPAAPPASAASPAGTAP